MTKPNIAQFVREVRQETAKVTWPTRRETDISTGMVVIMVVVAAIFFLVVDWLLGTGVKLFLGFGG
jgi:preprotein translocase subunit SecE